MKISLLLILTLLTVSVFGQTNKGYLSYGVEHLQMTNVFSSDVPLGLLLDPANLIHYKTDDGKEIVCTLDKKTSSGTTVTYLLTTKIDKKAALRMTVRFTIKEDEDLVSMTYIKVTNAVDGKYTQAEYDGTDNSLGHILGIFAGIAKSFVDVEKVNKVNL